MMTREFTVLTLAIAACASHGAAQDIAPGPDAARSPLHLVVADNVARELGRLADSLDVETVRCLIGITRGESAVVDLVWDPHADARSQPSAERLHRCPLATVALWRNHPAGQHQRPEDACYLSNAALRAAARPRAPPIQIVQVTAEVACWWTRAQIELSAGAETLESQPGQRRGDPRDRPPASCRGRLAHGNVCAFIRRDGMEAAPRRSNRPTA